MWKNNNNIGSKIFHGNFHGILLILQNVNLNVDVSKGTLLKDEVVAERLVIGVKQE